MQQPIFNRDEAAPALLEAWCDGLLAHQIAEGDDSGGLFCPACAMVHGRCGDAVYPLLAMFARTKNEKYRRAALDVFDWSQRRVSQPDGSFLNECYPGAWKGITCFSALAIGESLRHCGEHLTPETREIWRARLRAAADFLLEWMGFEVGDINYPISTAAALALAWTLLGDEKYLIRARELADFGRQHFTENGLLWGEGARGPDDVSPRGLRPVDVGYNVEESLPNLALYAQLVGDDAVLDVVVESLRAHLPFLLPDGGWDAGWCSRQYKWSYWGSRTTDGCAFGFAALQARDPRFTRAAALNLQLLAACTQDGLLFGGPHLHARGLKACIHHTFCHAKGLAAALDAGLLNTTDAALEKPRDEVRNWSESAVFQIVCGSWRASISANDLPHTPKRGGHPSGGALSLLWHRKTGPLCVASMTDYVRYEPTNMQIAASDAEKFVLTPRLEFWSGNDWFCSLHDAKARLEWRENDGGFEVRAHGVLTNQRGIAATNASYEFSFRFGDTFELAVSCAMPGARLVFPVVCAPADTVFAQNGALEIRKAGAVVSAKIEGAQWQDTNPPRVFNFVPGVEALPLSAVLNGQARVWVRVEAPEN